MKTRLTLIVAFLCSSYFAAPVFSGIPENIRFGLYGRSEQNIYRYYNGLSLGNFYTQRVSNGYSAGVMVHSSINYLFNAGISLGMSESSYSPNIKLSTNTLWKVQLRTWQFNAWGELKMGKNERKGLRLMAGLESLYVDYKREIWASENRNDESWPRSRVLPRIGLSYEYPFKKRFVLTPNAGLRLALSNRTGYDYIFNQFWAGAGISYRIWGD